MIEYKIKTATQKDIYEHLKKCDHLFIPPLSSKVDIKEYSDKLFDRSITFEAWSNNELVGFIAAYFNNPDKAFITNVSVLKKFNKMGIGGRLIDNAKEYSVNNGFSKISLEVNSQNIGAISLYKKNKFEIESQSGDSIFMLVNIK